MKRLLTVSFLIAAAVMWAKAPKAVPSAELGTIPPAVYVTDYYAPPPDWFPQVAISDYSVNTRVPDLTWLKYDGAYTMALRIKPVTKEQLEAKVKAQLIAADKLPAISEFSAATEKNGANRTIQVANLNVPGSDFIEFSFKMRAKTKNANPKVMVSADGLGQIITSNPAHEDKSVVCKDGFKAYKVTLKTHAKSKLSGFKIVIPAVEAYDPEEEYTFIDFNVKRKEPKARFADLPQRQWILKSAFEKEDRVLTVKDGIADVRAFIDSNPAGIESIALPMDKQDNLADPQYSTGVKSKLVKEVINGVEVDAIQFTLTKGKRCYLRFPVKLDATKFNTMTMFAKMVIPEGLPSHLFFGEHDIYNDLHGTNTVNQNTFFDSFSFGYHSQTSDNAEWSKWGVLPGHVWHSWQKNAKAPEGWRVLAHDVRNGDPVGNKVTTLDEVTHWVFYYDCRKIPEGKEIIVTLAAPKATAGLMHAGGDMNKYKAFRKDLPKLKAPADPSKVDYSKYLEPPATNRFATPLPLIRNHIADFEIVVQTRNRSHNNHYSNIIRSAAGHFINLLRNKYGFVNEVPILNHPSKKDNVKIILGGNSFQKVDRAQFQADMKQLNGTIGYAIRAKGKRIYIYSGDYNYMGDARGAANGMFMLAEKNTDYIAGMQGDGTLYPTFEITKNGNFDLVWGDNVLSIPSMPYSAVSNSAFAYLNINGSIFEDTWNYQVCNGGRRGTATGHWMGHIGTGFFDKKRGENQTENETWGVDFNGKRIKPDCYTRHNCMINSIEPAKKEYLSRYALSPLKSIYHPEGKGFYHNTVDILGFWLEDNDRYCLCEKCKTPIRLPNGDLLKYNDPQFRCTQFYINGTAMIHYVNVHAKRNMQIEPIGYFWMANPPAIEISRNFFIRFCAYFRKSYFEPIYSPCNDYFWRCMYRWGQLDVKQGLYDYFLNVNFRPWGTMTYYDAQAQNEIGVELISHEGDRTFRNALERWVTLRVYREPGADVNELRNYFIARVYRDAAPEMGEFYAIFYNYIFQDFGKRHLMELEDYTWIGVLMDLTKGKSGKSLLEEADGHVKAALEKVKSPSAKLALTQFEKHWRSYYNEAKRYSAELAKKREEYSKK